jgi:hypothetical protein
MTPEQLNLAQNLKDELEKDRPKPAETKNQAILELQKQATAVQQTSKMQQWASLSGYSYQEIGIVKMAELYYSMNWGWTIPQSVLMAYHCAKYDYQVDPAEGHVYMTPAGRIGTSLEGLKIKCEYKGLKIGHPKFEEVTRPWPQGKVLQVKGQDRVARAATMEQDQGVKCTLNINSEPMEYTAWASEWMVGTNPNWVDRLQHMLRVRAQMHCIKFATGIGVSEELVDSLPSEPVKQEPKAPKETPFGGK